MIPVPSGVRVWLAVGRTDMRRGMNGLALQVQQALGRDPHAGDLYVFRGARGNLIKIIWHDGIGMSLYAKRLEHGRFLWPSPADGTLAISAAQLAYMLDGIDWERRETDERQRVQVPYDEGVANHIGPESCAGGREAEREALTGVRVGQPLSGVRLPIRSANALQSAEGNTSRRVIASAGRLRVVVRPWHARTSLTREPRDLRFSPAGRAVGRTVKAGGRRP
jgi:transposase